MNLIKESEGIYFDFSRQRVTATTMEVSASRRSSGDRRPRRRSHTASPARPSVLSCCACAVDLRAFPVVVTDDPHTHLTTAGPQLLLKLAEAANLRQKIDSMFSGEHINSTEDRAVLHVATRARRDQARGRRTTAPSSRAPLKRI